MCRRLIIEFEWDDEEAEEAAGYLFDKNKDYDELTEFGEMILYKELISMFNGQTTVRIERMNG